VSAAAAKGCPDWKGYRMSLKERAEKYRQSLEHKHGWEVELECGQCGYRGMPTYTGWTPKYATGFGKSPTIFAVLKCARCGSDLEAEASSKLVKMFSEVEIPHANRRILVSFMVYALAMAVVAVLVAIFAGGLWWLVPLLLLTPSCMLIPLFNKRVASIRATCECGDADYIFMGMLGRAYCFRCSNCGRLLKLRD